MLLTENEDAYKMYKSTILEQFYLHLYTNKTGCNHNKKLIVLVVKYQTENHFPIKNEMFLLIKEQNSISKLDQFSLVQWWATLYIPNK